ncbi:MAG: helix-turn-helix domain-containing protein [Nitrospiria bacterium]
MENLGEHLKEKREALKITIDELSAQTRIPARFIEAIEADELDQLPNPVTAKGFLRSYAECVGVEASVVAETLTEYTPATQPAVETENQDEILSYLQVKKTMRVPFPRRIVLSVGGVIVLLLVLGGLLSNNGKEVAISPSLPLSPENTAQAPVSPVFPESPVFSENAQKSELAVPANEDPETPEKEAPSQNVSLQEGLGEPESGLNTSPAASDHPPSVVSEPAQDTEAVSTPKANTLFLEATEASWVQVTIDDGEIREALLQPEDTVQWEADKKFLLTLGNAGGVRVELNGEDLGLLGESGEVIHKEIQGAQN